MKKTTLYFLILLFLFGCSKTHQPQRSFCYWKSDYQFSASEAKMSDNLGVEHFYIRYFDLDWSEQYKQAIPVGEIQLDYNETFPVNNVTPAVYITNRVWEKTSKKEITDLARKTALKIKAIHQQIKEQHSWSYSRRFINLEKIDDWDKYDSLSLVADSMRQIGATKWDKAAKEILIDCDWTKATKDTYFAFLNELKTQLNGFEITSTLRLWQFRNPDISGVPPVKKCLLMCYNMGDIKDVSMENSIAMPQLMKPYFEGDTYPLKLDFALPVFGWNVLFRAGQFQKIVSTDGNLPPFSDTTYYQSIEKTTYRFLRDTVIGDTYLRNGDIIRSERVTDADLKEMISMIVDKTNLKNCSRVTFFSWDTIYIQQYETKKLSDFYSRFAD